MGSQWKWSSTSLLCYKMIKKSLPRTITLPCGWWFRAAWEVLVSSLGCSRRWRSCRSTASGRRPSLGCRTGCPRGLHRWRTPPDRGRNPTASVPALSTMSERLLSSDNWTRVKLCSDQAKANAKATFFFDVCFLFYDLFCFHSHFHLVWIGP